MTTAQLGKGDADPRLALGIGQPSVPWTILQRDRIYNVLLAGGQGSGKCVGPDELVLLEGRLIRAADAWEHYAAAPEWDGEGWWSEPLAQPLTNALDHSGRIVTAPVTRLYRQRVHERGRRVRLSDGSELTITQRHRLRAPDGWTRELQVGGVVCAPRRLCWPGRSLDRELVELLAWQIAEGCERGGGRSSQSSRGASVVTITQSDTAVLERLRQLALHIGERYGVQFNNPAVRPGTRASALVINSAAWRDFLVARGYDWGRLSAEKRIPDFVMQGDLEAARTFLRAYAAAEGCVQENHRTVELMTASRTLGEQVRALLRRFGILASFRLKRASATNGKGITRDYRRLTISGDSLRLFCSQIGIDHDKKDHRLARMLAGVKKNSNREGIPTKDILEAARAFGIPVKWVTDSWNRVNTLRANPKVAEEMGQRLRAVADRLEDESYVTPGARGVVAGRAHVRTLQRVDPAQVRVLADRLEQRLKSEVFFLTVEAIEEVELDGWVYDFEVAEHHNFVAGGMLAHNTSVLIRLAMGDILAANTAAVVIDWKGTLSERLLRLTPPDVPKRFWDEAAGRWREGTKRVWYLDFGRPAFGLTPLRVEAGWVHATLADEFARIGDAVTRALLDLYPGQIMGSSEDLIERGVVGTMAIAWWEHEQRCKHDGLDPTTRGFTGSFEVLAQMFAPSDRMDDQGETDGRRRRRVPPNRWHEAAGRACQGLPNLDQVADTLLYEIPRQARDNLGDIAKRMEAPANKIRPLVGAAASVRRFVGHPERLSLRSVIEAHDVLIVNPRVELIGEDQAAILTNFIIHMVDLQLKRQLAVSHEHRPRVSLIIDEAHRLITETLMTMVATHREAGFTAAAALQYVSQLGTDEPTAARREKIIKGVGNLFQTKLLFRMSDSDDANRHSQIFRSVFETMVRADPTSRARMPFDPSRMQTLRDHHALVSMISSATAGDSGLLDDSPGATRLPAFVTKTYRMREIEEIPQTWRAEHLARQAEIFHRYPEDMSALAVRNVPAGLNGTSPHAARSDPHEARGVAEQTIGRVPEGALRKDTSPSPTPDDSKAEVKPPPAGRDGHRGDPAFPAQAEPQESGNRGTREPTSGHRDESQSDTSSRGEARPAERPSWEDIGGVQIDRAEEPTASDTHLVATSPVLRFACTPTTHPLPTGELPAATPTGEEARRAAASLESITKLSPWRLAGEDAIEQAKRAAQAAREEALVEARAADKPADAAEELANQRARRAGQAALKRYDDAPWRTPVKHLDLNDAETHVLEVIARLRFAAPKLVAHLLEESATERTKRKWLSALEDAALIARSDVDIGTRGRRPSLYTIAPRGLEYLRLRRAQLAPDQEIPRYLEADRRLPEPGRGRDVPHELGVQVALVALRQYGGTATTLHWHTTRMPGGRWDVGMVHRDNKDRTMRLADLTPAPGLSVRGEHLDAPATLEPDVSVQLQGPAGGERAVIDMLLEVDRTRRGAYNANKFVAYDHFLGGWCLRTRRFGHQRKTRPVVVFVAPDSRAMLALLHGADAAMTLGFGGSGRYDPATFEYPGRAHTAFTCLDWLLAGQALALRLPALPPQVRGTQTELQPERVALMPPQWWPHPGPRPPTTR